jgi:hypothetical protein
MNNKEKNKILESIQIVVCYVDEKRVESIKKQIEDLNITIDVHYFKGWRPEESKDYIIDKDDKYDDLETNSQICCTRTFYGAVNWFAENCPKKQWLITCEDDISIVKKGFIKKLLDVIELSKSIEGEFDYISLGYLPIEGFVNYNGEQLYGNFKVYENLYYGFWEYHHKCNEDKIPIEKRLKETCVWGNQMTMIKRDVSIEMSKTLHKSNTKLVRESINEKMKNKSYSFRIPVLITDHHIPCIFRQALVFPPLSIEGDFNSLMEHGNNNLNYRGWKSYINISDYL